MPSIDQRYYTSTLGRFITIDRSTASLSLGNPQSWNRYAYVLGDPVNSNDPSGLCTAMLAGITMGPGNPGASQDLESERSTLGADAGYPYAGMNFLGSVLSVVSQATLGPNDSTAVALATLQDALNSTTGSIDVIAYSGGAQAFATAFSELSSQDQARFGNVVYIAPGMDGTLVTPPGANVSVVLGTGAENYGAGIKTRIPDSLTPIRTNCGHEDLACLLNNAPLYNLMNDGPCASQDVFVRAIPPRQRRPPLVYKVDYTGTGDFFDYLQLMFGGEPTPTPPPADDGVPDVTSTVTYHIVP